MGQVGRRVAAALLVVAAAACGSSSGSSVTLASYAAGKWSCTAPIDSPLGGHVTLKATGDVTTSSATTGQVVIDVETSIVPGAPKFPPFRGAWSLHAGELQVKWNQHDMGTLQAKPISLDTKQFQIRSGLPGNAKWSTVTVDRKARSVSFDFPVAITDSGPHATMTCRKA